MAPERTVQAVMFADVSGSSRLYKQQGNTQAKRQIDDILAHTRQIIESRDGFVIKTLGDEIMARFADGESACRAAMELQRQAQRSGNLALRIGMAFGDTLMDSSGDVFGDVVNDAAAVSHIARGRQIVITDALKAQLPDFLSHQCELYDKVALKGAAKPTAVFRLHWESTTQPHNATAVMDVAELNNQLRGQQLTLECQGQPRSLTPDQLPLSLGRDASQVNWVMDNNRVSREHCDIVFRRGKFVLIDHSTNGTYVCGAHSDPVYIRREETPLLGAGLIGLGQSPRHPNAFILRFWVSDTPL